MHPLLFGKKSIGWINKENKKQLEEILNKTFKDNINVKELLIEDKNIFKTIFDLLVELKIIKTNLREECPVFSYDALNPKTNFNQTKFFGFKKIFNIQRSLLSYFGFPAYGIHCNGWMKVKNEFFFFLGKRSKNIKKFPGLLDNLIGGGQPSNLSLRRNLAKEGWEEAGISKNHISKSKFSNAINYCHSYDNELSPSVMFIYDLHISNEIKFQNKDGEIESFKCLSLSEIFDLIDMKKLKPNSIIPIACFIINKDIEILNKNALKELKKHLKI